MSTPVKDGGPAFPVPNYVELGDSNHRVSRGEIEATHGMSLRDWFAGQALVGSMASDTEGWQVSDPKDRATVAYLLADAMLAARERKEAAS